MKKVICVVEDEKDLNELVKRYLEKEGYEVRSYYTYEQASMHTVDDDVHLWILDIMLDDKSGFDLIEEIRLQGKDIPVIFMSARDKEFDRIIGLDKLCALHLNDSKNPFQSHKDRHECLGDGSLGVETFRAIVNHPALKNKPMILETPNELDGYAREIALLRQMENT